jgi:hypothetical protein
METKQEEIAYIYMRRTTDGDGPHPIHPAEVENYIKGDWVVVEEPKAEMRLEDYKRPELFKIAAEYNVETRPQMKNEEIISLIKAAAGYSTSTAPQTEQN